MENLIDNKENLMWLVPILFHKYQLRDHARWFCTYADSVFCYLCWIQTCFKEDSVNLVDNTILPVIYPIYQKRFDGLTFKVSCIVVWFYMQLTCIYFLHMVQCTYCWSQMPCCPQRRTTFFLQMFLRKNEHQKKKSRDCCY